MEGNQNRIYLVYPPISKWERYSSEIGSAGGNQIPLGIYYLASYARQNNFNVKVTDAEALKLNTQQIIDQIRNFEPGFVGISSTSVAFHRAVGVAGAIKSNFPGIKIILGGPHITANPQHAMSFKEFDYGVLHEGEATILELLRAVNNQKDVNCVKGIAFRNSKSEIILTPKREYVENLDSLPFPAFDLLDNISAYTPPPSNYKTLPCINMITSRGCPNQCTFCDNNTFGRKYRYRSAENIVAEIKDLREKYGVREIAFVDDSFLIDKKRIYNLFGLLERENIFFDWTCMSCINNMDYDFLKFIKSRGCWHISFGIESGDEKILKIVKKNISLSQVEEVIELCHKLKIKTKGFFIIGHPTETMETINKTIEFACKLKLDDIVTTTNTPIPGSQQYAEADKYGTLDESNWAEFNYWRPVFVPRGLTKDIIVEKHREMYRRFYLRPRILLRYFLSFFGRGGLKRFIAVSKASLFVLKKIF